jgi:hypothetical protein
VATEHKDFVVKHGIVVEGSTATVNGNNVLTTASSLDSLGDVVITSATTDQVLKYNGTNWVNGTGGSSSSTVYLNPIIIGETTADFANNTTGTLNLPITQENDLVIVMIGSDGSTPDLPSGWTNIDNTTGGAAYQRIFYKIMTSTPDTSVAISGISTRSSGLAIAFRNVNTTTPIDTTNSALGTTGGTGDPDPASVTTQYDNQLVLAFGMLDDDVATLTNPPTGYINAVYSASGTSAGTASNVMFASKKVATSGTSEDAPAFDTTGSDDWIAHSVLLNRVSTSGTNADYVLGNILNFEEAMTISLSDDNNTSITTGTSKAVVRAPFPMRLTKIPRASLKGTGSGSTVIDINADGISILSTKLSIDASELTSVTAATSAVLSQDFIGDDAEITFDIDTAGNGADGLKVTIYYQRV